MSSPVWGQGTYIVDPSDSTRYPSITAAANAAFGTVNSVIEVVGMTDINGAVAYSQASPAGETFPIQLPAGCTLKPHNSTAVYIWDSVGGSTPPDLIHTFSGVPPAGAQSTKILNINFGGGANAIFASAPISGLVKKVVVRNSQFFKNQYAVTGQATAGGELRIRVEDCAIEDSVPQTGRVFIASMQSAGLRFHALTSSGSQRSVTRADVVDLVLKGSFPPMNMNPQPALTTSDLTVPTTRLIEVYAEGDYALRQHPSAPSSYVTTEIPEVFLTVQGGEWVQLLVDGGWDTAIHGEATGMGDGGVLDYHAGYDITVTGTEINNFREDGIYCGSHDNARGHLKLNGGTRILRTGIDAGNSFDELRNNGVHLFSSSSYTGIQSGTSSFKGNRGNGIYANTYGIPYADVDSFRLVAPMGIYMEVKKCGIHGNGANGVLLRNLRDYPGHLDAGFIGGTIHQNFVNMFNIESNGEGFSVPHGQGIINRVSISNNGFAGVRVRAAGGTGFEPEQPNTLPSGVALRVSNAFIWNNPFGGVDGKWLASNFDTPRKGYYLVPVTHCTLVENGNGTPGSGWSMEIDDAATSNADRATFIWDEPGQTKDLNTVVWNSILIRDLATGFGADLGMYLNNQSYSVIDIGTITIADHEIGFAGVRGRAFWGINTYPTSALMAHILTMPFVGVGSYDLTSLNPGQFHIAPGSIEPQIVDSTPAYFHVNGTETSIDFGGQARPGSGANDKGADEL